MVKSSRVSLFLTFRDKRLEFFREESISGQIHVQPQKEEVLNLIQLLQFIPNN